MVAQASKNMTSAQKLKEQKLMEADVSDPSSSEDGGSREKPRRTPKAASNSQGAAAAVASGRQPSAIAPKVAGCLEDAQKEKSVAAAPKAAPKPKSAPAASISPIGIEQWVQSTHSFRATSSLAALQGRAAAAAGNVRSVHTGAPKLKTSAAVTT
jgi:hypothetical protein